VAILCEGRIVAAASPAEFVSRSRARPRLEIRTARAMSVAEAAALPGVVASGVDGTASWLETADAGKTMTALLRHLEGAGNALLDVQTRPPSLEDVFIELTGRPWSADPGEAGP
jgi:ABC-type multidrug transport system ATPase subunit